MNLRFYILLFFALVCFFPKAHGQNIAARQKYLLKRGSTAVLRADATDAASYLWYKNNVLLKGEIAPTLAVTDAGIYKVLAQNATNCLSDATEIEILLEEPPSADVAITKRSESREVLSNQSFSYYLNARNNGPKEATNVNVVDILPENLVFESLRTAAGNADYKRDTRTVAWLIPSLAVGNAVQLELIVKATAPGKASNTATVSATEQDPKLDNNTATDHKQIGALHVHNVFTPNGDGKNDTFTIDNLSSFEENQLTIVNRWQSTVYQTKNYKNDWNGSELSDGTYFYIIKVRNGQQPWIEQKGYVTLLR